MTEDVCNNVIKKNFKFSFIGAIFKSAGLKVLAMKGQAYITAFIFY
jgi:hypothetical protein